jgi:hypothetical protein
MTTIEKTVNEATVTNVEVASDGVIVASTTEATTTTANVKAAKVERRVTGGEYAQLVKLEHAMDAEVIIGKTRKEYFADYSVNLKKSAEGTLQMCRTVYEASKMLSACDFDEFCKQIGYKDSSSTIRKFVTIGKVYPRLIQYADSLPIGWTSIYTLTQIGADDFDKLVQNGFALKNLKGKDLTLLLERTKDLNNINGLFKLHKKWLTYNAGHICFTKVPDDRDWRLIEKAFEELSARLPVKFVMSKEQADVFKSRRAATYEDIKGEDKDAAVKPQKWDYGVTANGIIEECIA